MVLKRNDGTEAVATLKPKLFGLDVPQVEIDGKLIDLVKPLAWQQWIFAASPLVILFLGGALGVALAFIGVYTNLKIFRSERDDMQKYIFSAVITMALFFGYLIFSFVLGLLIYQL